MNHPDPSQHPELFLTKSEVQEEFSLTRSQVAQLGEPDATSPNPHYRNGSPVRLYLRERIERWVGEHGEVQTEAERRREASRKAVETKRARTRAKLAALVQDLKMWQAPNRVSLLAEVGQFLFDRYGDVCEVSERMLCSYIRHTYTNYEAILAAVEGLTGARDLYPAVKLYLCCRVIGRYGLEIDPLVAAFESKDQAPACFQVADPEAAAAEALGLSTEVRRQP